MKPKSLCRAKEVISRNKTYRMGENTCKSLSEMGLITKIHMKLTQLKSKNSN